VDDPARPAPGGEGPGVRNLRVLKLRSRVMRPPA